MRGGFTATLLLVWAEAGCSDINYTPNSGATDPATDGATNLGVGAAPGDSSTSPPLSTADTGALPEDDGGNTSGMAVTPTPSVFDTPSTCTSASFWLGGNQESPFMRPGYACIACHLADREAPLFSIAGTLYPTAHEPDDCNGTSGNGTAAEVIITGADGTEHRLTINAAGNFYSSIDVVLPLTARVVVAGRERRMLTPQPVGDCNMCHSEVGANGAPGRILLP